MKKQLLALAVASALVSSVAVQAATKFSALDTYDAMVIACASFSGIKADCKQAACTAVQTAFPNAKVQCDKNFDLSEGKNILARLSGTKLFNALAPFDFLPVGSGYTRCGFISSMDGTLGGGLIDNSYKHVCPQLFQ